MKNNHSWNYADLRAKFPLTSKMSLILLLAASSSLSANGNAVQSNEIMLPPPHQPLVSRLM